MKFIEIILTKSDRWNKRKQIDKCLITDNLAITKYSDPNQSFRVYNEKRKEGKQNVSWTRGVLSEDFPEMKKEQILKLMVQQIELLKNKMKDQLVIKYEIKERE